MTRKLRNVLKDAWAARNPSTCTSSLTSTPAQCTNTGGETLFEINVGVNSRCCVHGKITFMQQYRDSYDWRTQAPWGAHLLGTHGGQPRRRHGGHWGHADLSCHLVHVAHPTCVGRHGYIDVHIIIVHAGVCLLPKVWWRLLWKHARMQWRDVNVSALMQTGRQFWAPVSLALTSEWIKLGWESPGWDSQQTLRSETIGLEVVKEAVGTTTAPWRSGSLFPTFVSVLDKLSVCFYYTYW